MIIYIMVDVQTLFRMIRFSYQTLEKYDSYGLQTILRIE